MDITQEFVDTLQPGDEVEITLPSGTRVIGIATGVGDGLGLAVPLTKHGYDIIKLRYANGEKGEWVSGVRLLRPVAPFPVGARIRRTDRPGNTRTVTGWTHTEAGWRVDTNGGFLIDYREWEVAPCLSALQFEEDDGIMTYHCTVSGPHDLHRNGRMAWPLISDE
jgi:hypothetical protein